MKNAKMQFQCLTKLILVWQKIALTTYHSMTLYQRSIVETAESSMAEPEPTIKPEPTTGFG